MIVALKPYLAPIAVVACAPKQQLGSLGNPVGRNYKQKAG